MVYIMSFVMQIKWLMKEFAELSILFALIMLRIFHFGYAQLIDIFANVMGAYLGALLIEKVLFKAGGYGNK